MAASRRNAVTGGSRTRRSTICASVWFRTDRRPEVAGDGFDVVLARGRMQDGFKDDADRIGKSRRRIGHPGRKMAQSAGPDRPALGRASMRQQSKYDKAQRENAGKRNKHVRRRHRKHHGIAFAASMQDDESAPRERVTADLRAEIMELGDECRRKRLLTLRAVVEEGRDQSVDGALMRRGASRRDR